MATISNIEQSRWRKHYCLFIDRLTRFESILYPALTLARLKGCQHISHLEFTSFWYTMPRVSCHSQFRNKGLATIRTHKFILTNILRIFWIFFIILMFYGNCSFEVSETRESFLLCWKWIVFKQIIINLNFEIHNITICEMKQ